MNQNEFNSVLALARSSLKQPNSAIRQHIKRLIKILEEQEEFEKVQSLKSLFDDCSSIPKPKVILRTKTDDWYSEIKP